MRAAPVGDASSLDDQLLVRFELLTGIVSEDSRIQDLRRTFVDQDKVRDFTTVMPLSAGDQSRESVCTEPESDPVNRSP